MPRVTDIIPQQRFEGHLVSGYAIGCDISPDGALVASGSAHGGLYFYDWHSARRLRLLSGQHTTASLDVAFHPVLPRMVASCCWDGRVCFFE